MDKLTSLHGAVGVRLSTWNDPEVLEQVPLYSQLERLSAQARTLPSCADLPKLAQILDQVTIDALSTQESSEAILARAQAVAVSRGLRLAKRPHSSDSTRMRLSRVATLGWALVLFALAVIVLHHGGRVVEVGLQIASVAYGALLGAFLLGTLTRRANALGTMLGMICGFSVELYLWLGTTVPWTWWVTVGCCVTFLVGIAASSLTGNS